MWVEPVTDSYPIEYGKGVKYYSYNYIIVYGKGEGDLAGIIKVTNQLTLS